MGKSPSCPAATRRLAPHDETVNVSANILLRPHPRKPIRQPVTTRSPLAAGVEESGVTAMGTHLHSRQHAIAQPALRSTPSRARLEESLQARQDGRPAFGDVGISTRVNW